MTKNLRRAVAVRPREQWPADQPASRITLAYEDRHRRRLLMQDDDGAAFMLDLPQAVLLADGDGLELESGGFILVIAAEEDVAELQCSTPEELARIAWHIGNRHMAVQIIPGGLRLPWDHVLVEMLAGLGARVEKRRAPFHPESGAYAKSHDHAPAHGYKRA
ncbi:MAG TPA: urease accessory protein UreE [Candidatus Sulfotelmatobacter sp.]|jgi:urease accessory protein|nr:urease accessory protein UreE [Candidatus Sulfotelmatobacter sp.]